MTKIVQFSNIGALLEGYFDGEFDIKNKLKENSFGLGCSDNTDGELTILNGKAWEACADKHVRILENNKVPFVQVTSFEAESTIETQKVTDKNIKDIINQNIKLKNIFLAVKVRAKFNKISIRRPNHSGQKLNNALELAKTQKVDNLTNIDGNLIGFWTPQLFSRVSVPGFHFHFLSEDKKFSGHVLSFETDNADIQYEEKDGIEIKNPNTDKYKSMNIDLEKIDNLIEKVEK